MNHSTGKPTKAQQARFEALIDLGCIACRAEGFHSEAEIHHLVEGQKRLGHDFTLPLCPWHHRGVQSSPYNEQWPLAEMRSFFGPSLAVSKRAFTAHFGTERELLAGVNRLIGAEA